MLDPSAPLPPGFPGGAPGAFLVFFFPIGGGIPIGVLMARDGGVPFWGTALVYLLSDVCLAFMNEPLVMAARWLARRVAFLRRMGSAITRLTSHIGLRGEGAWGPLGLILVSFSVSMTAGRAAAAAAGHGFLPGWALAIIGDMGYFALLMTSTLWLSSVLGDDRLVVGVVIGASLLLPVVIRRVRHAGAGLRSRGTSGPSGGSPLAPVEVVAGR